LKNPNANKLITMYSEFPLSCHQQNLWPQYHVIEKQKTDKTCFKQLFQCMSYN